MQALKQLLVLVPQLAAMPFEWRVQTQIAATRLLPAAEIVPQLAPRRVEVVSLQPAPELVEIQ